ncbi:MAG: 16S rRNA (adenine(1518)-N(6)/adenine(1519)-N(6))-dimethyltransferase RsmA [Candidatus Margulisiibacteriota bacterium]|jgi:16S rRNA (adenine1518-N6/adenine1519-N6)-dimethyltransferase
MPRLSEDSVIRPKKSLGQNFLNDQNSLQKIVKLCEVKPQDVVLEIGAGTGLLTEKLQKKAGKLYILEIEQILISKLEARFKEPNVTIFHEDILKFDFNRINEQKFRVIANIPYYISTKIIKQIIANLTRIEDVILLVQKEFAGKLMAEPRHKNYTSLTLYANYFFEIKKLTDIKNTCFFPKPKVDSSLIKLTPRHEPLFKVNEDNFFNLIRSCFHLRRKYLINSLDKSPYLNLKPGFKEIEFFKSNPKIRAEELSLADYYQMYLALEERISF